MPVRARVVGARGETRVGHRLLCRRHAHLALAAHHLQALCGSPSWLPCPAARNRRFRPGTPWPRRPPTSAACPRERRSSVLTPLRPADMASQSASLPLPKGQTTPSPVITTLGRVELISTPPSSIEFLEMRRFAVPSTASPAILAFRQSRVETSLLRRMLFRGKGRHPTCDGAAGPLSSTGRGLW